MAQLPGALALSKDSVSCLPFDKFILVDDHWALLALAVPWDMVLPDRPLLCSRRFDPFIGFSSPSTNVKDLVSFSSSSSSQ